MRKDCFRWIYVQIEPRIPALLLLAILNITESFLSVQFALKTQAVIDSAIGGNGEYFKQTIMHLGGVIVFSILSGTLALHVNRQLIADMDRDFKRNIVHKILRSDYCEISKFHSGDLVNRMNGDVHTVYAGVLTLVSTTTVMVTSLVSVVAALAKLAPIFTVAIVCISMGIAFVTLLIQKKMKQLQKDSSAAHGRINGFLQESISKLLVVQALDVAPEIEKRADAHMEEKWQIQRKQKNMSLFMNLATRVLSYLGAFVTLVWCAIQLLNGHISFGQLTAITQLVGRLQSPMLSLPGMIPQVVSIMASCERLMEIEEIALQPSVADENIEHIYEDMTGITAKGLTFSYDRDKVLNDVSFSLPKGGLTVITGISGAGKSTLLKLLLGIYRPNSGGLYIEKGEEEISLTRSVRKLFSYAPQGNLLLSGTLRDNLLLTKPDATKEELEKAIYVSAMDAYISQLPEGLDTRLGENGAGLSEGQAQRLSLARAVLSGAPILLLDEVTSALDAHTEQVVLERICSLKDRTCIAVTHRPAALEMADYQLVVSEKEITLVSLVK